MTLSTDAELAGADRSTLATEPLHYTEAGSLPRALRNC